MLSSIALASLLLAEQDSGLTPEAVITLVVVLVVLFGLLIFAVIFLTYARWWIQSLFSKAGIGLFDLIGMSFKKVKPSIIVPCKICLLYTSPSPRDS